MPHVPLIVGLRTSGVRIEYRYSVRMSRFLPISRRQDPAAPRPLFLGADAAAFESVSMRRGRQGNRRVRKGTRSPSLRTTYKVPRRPQTKPDRLAMTEAALDGVKCCYRALPGDWREH